jgi:hypothetical protein
MSEHENDTKDGSPPGAVHERMKQREAGRFSSDPDGAMGSASSDEKKDMGSVLDGRPEYPGGDVEEKVTGGGGDETGVTR